MNDVAIRKKTPVKKTARASATTKPAAKAKGKTTLKRGYPDLHDHLKTLDKAGLLVTVKRKINKDTEMHPLVRWQFRGGIEEKDRKAFLFTNVTDSKKRKFDIPVVVGVLAANREIYRLGMNCDLDKINQTWIDAMANPIPPNVVTDAPCQEIVIEGKELDKPGKGGLSSRVVSYGFASPGQLYPYTAAGAVTNGKTAIIPGAQLTQGWGPVALLLKLPPWTPDSVTRNALLSLQFTVPAGSKYAEFQFGYSRWGMPNQLFCTPRAEACNSSTPSGSPFNFESDRRSLRDCSVGCQITIPVVSSNLIYFRLRRSNDGVTWVDGDVQALAVP